ncbi:MAG: hypothetical protein FJY86_00725 [Candidatus Diapherotrites archaeon]|uniref:Uncharacterized protein n=1 Tax=Candidatus Iainarchaeum sp. TaxID=3101447 RepID=A0A8T4C5S7_9ARCH|nr:hypothetical protein [Candidatus Diapherotrites archaeon]
MEINRITIGIALLILVGLAFVYVSLPDVSPTALVSGTLPTYNPFIGKVTHAVEKIFANNPQAVIEQSNRVGIVLPGGNSVQFANDAASTKQDVVIILNASTNTLTQFNTYPTFVDNQFTYIPVEQLSSEGPYVKALYPNGLYLMPIDVGS